MLVPAFFYGNRSLDTQAVTKQELPKYQAEQNPTYQNDSLEKKTNEKLFSKTDSLVKNSVLSSYQTLKFAHSKVGWCGNWCFLSDFGQQLCRKNEDVINIYFALLDAAC